MSFFHPMKFNVPMVHLLGSALVVLKMELQHVVEVPSHHPDGDGLHDAVNGKGVGRVNGEERIAAVEEAHLDAQDVLVLFLDPQLTSSAIGCFRRETLQPFQLEMPMSRGMLPPQNAESSNLETDTSFKKLLRLVFADVLRVRLRRR